MKAGVVAQDTGAASKARVATHDAGAAAKARAFAGYDTDAAGVSLRLPERRAMKALVTAAHDTDAAMKALVIAAHDRHAAAKAPEQVVAAHDAVPR